MTNVKPTTTFKTALTSLVLLPAAFVACGCSSDDPAGDNSAAATTTTGSGGASTASNTTSTTTDASATGTTGAPTGCLSTMASDGSLQFMVTPANNYMFDSTVTLTVQKVAPNSPLTFNWSELTHDITKQPIDINSGEVAAVLVSLLTLTPEDFQARLNANERLNTYSIAAMAVYPDPTAPQTTADIYEFAAPGSDTPLFAEEINGYLDNVKYPPTCDPADAQCTPHTYTVLVQDITEAAKGVRAVQAFQLDPESLITEVKVTDTSADLQYTTDLTAVVPVQFPAGTANITADWSGMKDLVNGLGDTWIDRQIDEVMIGHYSLTPAELNEQFLALENIADQMYRGPVTAGDMLNLNALVEENTGAAFPGIDDTGTWILALNCTTKCTNPAPWYLTILKPCQ